MILLGNLESIVDARVVQEDMIFGECLDAITNTAYVFSLVERNRLDRGREAAVFSAALLNRRRCDPDEAVSAEDHRNTAR